MWPSAYLGLSLPFIAVYLETYGCQMNVNDTEIAWSILQKSGYLRTSSLQEVLEFLAAVSWAWAPLLWCRFLDALYLRKRMLPAELDAAACLWVMCYFLLVTCTVGLAHISSAILSFHDALHLQERSDQTCCGNMWL